MTIPTIAAETTEQWLTAAQFCDRYRLTLSDLLILVHDYHLSTLSQIIDNGSELVVFAYADDDPDSGLLRIAPERPALVDDPANPAVTIEEFCRRFAIDAGGLLRLALARDLPTLFSRGREVVFRDDDVNRWVGSHRVRLAIPGLRFRGV